MKSGRRAATRGVDREVKEVPEPLHDDVRQQRGTSLASGVDPIVAVYGDGREIHASELPPKRAERKQTRKGKKRKMPEAAAEAGAQEAATWPLHGDMNHSPNRLSRISFKS